MDNNKKKRLEKTLGGIRKKFGERSIMKASEAAAKGYLTKRRIKTPSLELNDMLNGGFAGIVELFGTTGSGKTSLAIEVIALAQREDPDFVAAWLETEGSITEEILEQHGVDLDRLIFWKQEDVGNAESALDIARALIEAGDIDIMIVNSVAGFAPKTETEDDMEKQNIALVARMLSKFFRVITGPAAKNDITMVFINQVRDAVGVMFGDPTTTPGGKALGFYASQRIKMNRNKIQSGDPIKEEDGIKISCISWKNRFAGKRNPYTKCVYYATYRDGIDSVIALPQMLLNAGIVRQSGSWWYYEDAQGNVITKYVDPCKWNSKNAFLEALRTNECLRDELVSKLDKLADNQTEAEISAIKAQDEQLAKEFDEVEKMEEAEEINQILAENDSQ